MYIQEIITVTFKNSKELLYPIANKQLPAFGMIEVTQKTFKKYAGKKTIICQGTQLTKQNNEKLKIHEKGVLPEKHTQIFFSRYS